jgi:hypothetical protein
VGDTGTGKGPKIGYGSLASAEVVLYDFGTSILLRSFEYGLLTVAGTAFPQFVGAIFAGYVAYRGIMKIRDLKAEYDELEGSVEERLARLAVREGVRIIVGETLSMGLEKPTDEIIDRAIHTTVDGMSKAGVFSEIVKRTGLPAEYSDDLRYFFMSTSRRVVKGSFAGADDKLADYAAREIA